MCRDAAVVRNLSSAGNLTEAAANLFAMLRELDAGAERIAVMPIPERGLGEAINDRLASRSRPARRSMSIDPDAISRLKEAAGPNGFTETRRKSRRISSNGVANIRAAHSCC